MPQAQEPAVSELPKQRIRSLLGAGEGILSVVFCV